MKVLVCVPDFEENRRIRRHVEGIGWEAFSAYSSAECLRQIVAQWPDVVLLDAALGFEVVREFRQKPWFEPIVVVGLTATDEEVFETYESGGDVALPKPLDLSELRALFPRD